MTTHRLIELRREARRIAMFTNFGRRAENKELRCLADKKLAAIDREIAEGQGLKKGGNSK